jgi:hypothetical protein
MSALVLPILVPMATAAGSSGRERLGRFSQRSQ